MKHASGFAITAKRLSDRLDFCGRSREELAAALEAEGQHCELETIKAACCKADRPYLIRVNTMLDVVTSKWVKEREREIGDRIRESSGDGQIEVEAVYIESPYVAILQDGRYIGRYDTAVGRMLGR